MNYNINFSIGSVLFLLICFIFYYTKKRIPGKSNSLYRVMMITSLLAVIFDALSGVCEDYSSVVPRTIIYFINISSFTCMHVCLYCYVLYVFILANVRLTRIKEIVLMIPFLVVISLLLLSTTGKYFIFYLDSDNKYVSGMLHDILYLVTGIYLIISIIVVLMKKKIIRLLTKAILSVTCLGIIGLTLFQLLNPEYLVTASATAIGVFLIYFLLEAPEVYIDQSTNTFNRNAITPLFDSVKNSKEGNVILVTIHSLSQINNIYGSEAEEMVLAHIAIELNKIYPKGYICHCYHSSFIIFLRKDYETITHLQTMLNEAKEEIVIDGKTVQFQIGVILYELKNFKTATELFNIIDYSLMDELDEPDKAVVLDTRQISRFISNQFLENNLLSFISSGNILIKLSEVYDENDNLIATEVIPFVAVNEYGSINYDDLMKIVDKSKNTYVFYFQILELIKELDNKKTYYLRLSNKFFETDEINELFAEFKNIKCLDLAVNEKALSLASKDAFQRINRLIDMGYNIIVDEFGSGYNDVNQLLKYKFIAVRMNYSKLKQTMNHDALIRLIKLVKDIMNQISIGVVLANLSSENQVAEVKEIGIKYYQRRQFI